MPNLFDLRVFTHGDLGGQGMDGHGDVDFSFAIRNRFICQSDGLRLWPSEALHRIKKDDLLDLRISLIPIVVVCPEDNLITPFCVACIAFNNSKWPRSPWSHFRNGAPKISFTH